MDKNKSPSSFRANFKGSFKAGFKASSNSADAKRMKRSKIIDDTMWDCSVCTYRNSVEAFKCLMCDVRKGTSTRKPRLNPELVAAQVAQVVPPPKLKKAERKERRGDGRPLHRGRPRLKNVDRSTAEHNAVTVNNVTVIITEFQPKQRSAGGNTSLNGADTSHIMSSSEAGSISDASEDTRNGELGATEYRSS